jgi:CubicO group peptidase (beta-lactamase class C family)
MKTILTCLFIIAGHFTLAQSGTLIPNKKISGKIVRGEKHKYDVNLKANYFSLIVVQQDGVDLEIRSSDPSGKFMETVDSPNGKNGPEPMVIISKSAGKHFIEVYPLDESEEGGKYTIELVRTEPKGTTPEKQVEQLMSTQFDAAGAGATIAVAKGDKILFSKGYGLSNPEYDIPNAPNTIFHIASISKQFTAFSIAMLADQGKISVDDDIRKYLPELPDFGHKITIKQLAHHSSGLRDQWNLLAMAGWRLDDVITRSQVLRLLSNQKDLNFKPGEEFNYCNSGYTLMAEIVSRVSGKSFGDWTSENIFKPLGMTNTLFYEDHEKIVRNRAYSFHGSPEGLKKSVLSYANAGATSLFTTAEDLTKWSENFRSMKVGNQSIMKQMEEKCILNKGDTLNYAFGQDVSTYRGLKAVSHGGADAGYRSFLVRFPEQGYSIAVLSNFAAANTGSIAYKIADIFLKDFLKEEPKKPEPAAEGLPIVSVSEDLLKLYSGQYEIEPGVIATFVIENGKLVAKASGQGFAMVPKSQNEFLIASIDASVTFEKSNDNLVNQMILKQGGRTVIAPRVKAPDLNSIDLNQFTGVYYSPELETSYTFAIVNNKLVGKHIRHEPMELTPSGTDRFTSTAWYFGLIEFVRDDKGRINGLKGSSGRVKNLKFEKLR